MMAVPRASSRAAIRKFGEVWAGRYLFRRTSPQFSFLSQVAKASKKTVEGKSGSSDPPDHLVIAPLQDSFSDFYRIYREKTDVL